MPCQEHLFTFNIYMKPIKTDKVQAKSPAVAKLLTKLLNDMNLASFM